MLPLKPLSIVERWDCHSCGLCCRDAMVPLNDEDVAKLVSQRWEEQPEFRGVKVTVRTRIGGAKAVLAQKPDGACVFLTADERCRIHELHGIDAKPKVCRQFPLQVVPVDGKLLVAARRSCPSAAKGEGRPVEQHLAELRQVLPQGLDRVRSRPPAIIAGHARDWADTRAVTDAIARMLCDTRFPLVRRFVHGLEFCDLLADCKPAKLKAIGSRDFGELVKVAEESARESAGEWFTDRQPPKRGAATAFRQAAGETLRLHQQLSTRPGLGDRLRMVRNVFSITRGRGKTPPLVPGFPTVEFESLNSPLGRVDLELLRPLDDYFQTLAVSLRYCTLAYRKWSVVEGLRALAIQFPIALWCWRWASGNQLTSETLIPIIVCLDRAHTAAPLTSWRHKRRCDVLSVNGQLQRLVAWNAR